MIFRNCRSASSMPAAVQRSAISPDDQRFTLRWVRRTILEHRLARVRALECAFQRAGDAEPSEGERLFHAFAQRAGRAGAAAVELAGKPLELVEGARVIVERPRPPQPELHLRPVPLGQMV